MSNPTPDSPFSFDTDIESLLNASSRSIHQAFYSSLMANISTNVCPLLGPGLFKAPVMTMESRGKRSIRSTAELSAHQMNGHLFPLSAVFDSVCVCVCTTPQCRAVDTWWASLHGAHRGGSQCDVQ